MNLRKQFNIFGKAIGIYMTDRPTVSTVGLTSETSDCYQILLLDYDQIDYTKVRGDLLHLNKVFGLCTFIVTTSGEEEIDDGVNTFTQGSYNVFGLCKLTYGKLLEVLEHTRIDYRYRLTLRRYSQRNLVLRIAEKVKDGKTIRIAPKLKEFAHFRNNCRHKHSSAHWKFYNTLWDLPNINPPVRWDGLKEIEIINYKTR